MGWYLRKSVKFGPLRMNLSKSGIGYSFGVKGARIGTGPRGPYIAGGRYGLYYRQSLKGASRLAPTLPGTVRDPIIAASPNAQCAHCGAPITTGDHFCTRCGSPIPTPEPILSQSAHAYCTNCGASILAQNRFCIECGVAVDSPEKHDHHLSWWLVAGGVFVALLFLRLLGS